jgi:hypothetical protein
MNLHVMNLLTVNMAENDLIMLMMVDVKSKEWPEELDFVFWKKILRRTSSSHPIKLQTVQY